MKISALICGCAALLPGAAHLEAQTLKPQSAPASQPVTPDEIAGADLSITANISARELRFEQVGRLKVEFSGAPRRKTVWEEERQNIARPAQPGVTYRDIGSQLRISSRFEAIERIVAQALGQIAASSPTPDRSQAPGPNAKPIPAPLSPRPVLEAPKAVLSPKVVLPVKPLSPTRAPGR